jgi:hypothetical protein
VFPIHFLIHWSFDHAQISPISAPLTSLKIVAERPPHLPAAILSRAFLLLSLLLLYCFKLTTTRGQGCCAATPIVVYGLVIINSFPVSKFLLIKNLKLPSSFVTSNSTELLELKFLWNFDQCQIVVPFWIHQSFPKSVTANLGICFFKFHSWLTSNKPCLLMCLLLKRDIKRA